ELFSCLSVSPASSLRAMLQEKRSGGNRHGDTKRSDQSTPASNLPRARPSHRRGTRSQCKGPSAAPVKEKARPGPNEILPDPVSRPLRFQTQPHWKNTARFRVVRADLGVSRPSSPPGRAAYRVFASEQGLASCRQTKSSAFLFGRVQSAPDPIWRSDSRCREPRLIAGCNYDKTHRDLLL